MKRHSKAGIIFRIVFLLFYSVLFLISVSCQKEEKLSPIQSQTVSLKTEVKISVGGILYENVDAHLKVTGLDVSNQVQWMSEFEYTGPADTLAVQLGHDHYIIELVNKWGINDSQSISAQELWDGRLDGSKPVTYGLGGSIAAKKLTKYISYVEIDNGGTKVYQPETRVFFNYNKNGRLESIHHETYNAQTLQFSETSVDSFTFTDSVLTKIATTLNGNPAQDYLYDGNKITETDYNSGITTTQVTTKHFETTSPTVSVDYSFSNGNSIAYSFVPVFKNIAHDKTISADQLCNQGDYTFDKNINPFRHIGYMDFNLQNWSVNNKLAERVDFLACSYSTLIPLFHYYTYDLDGYPIQKNNQV